MTRAAPKIALLGAGRMGAIHGRNAAANPRLQLAYISDPGSELADRLASELHCQTSTLAEALSDPDLAAVIIASSTDTHLDLALAALAAGKAVFCEKPLDRELSRLRMHETALTRPGSALYIAFNRRFDPHFQALKAKIASGQIGVLETLNLISHDPAPPPPAFIPTSGGLFTDFTIHDFDMTRWLLDEEPTEVFAWATCLVDPAIAAAGDVDTARVLLRCASGRLGMISNTRRSGYGYDQRAEAFGSKGMACVANPRTTTVEAWSEVGPLAAPIFGSFPDRYAQAYRAELDHFADVLSGTVAPLTGYKANLAALRLAEAAGRSLRSGASVRVQDI